MHGRAVAGKASPCPSLFAAEASRAGMKGCAQDVQDVSPSHLLRSVRQPVDLFCFRSCVAACGMIRCREPWTGMLCKLDICVAGRCRVSCLILQVFVNSSCWRWYRIVIRGGETRVDRFGHAEAAGRYGCLACVRRCLPAWGTSRLDDRLSRSYGTVVAQYAICSSVLDGRKHSMALLCSWRGAMEDGLGGVQLGGV